jgi:acyl carrier protein
MDKVKQIVSEALNTKVELLTDDTSLYDIDNWDSLNHMVLITQIEEKFEIELTNDEIIDMTTVKDIKKALAKRNINHL